MDDSKAMFTMRMTRTCHWADAAALTNDVSKLWTPRHMLSFPQSSKVYERTPATVVADGSQMTLTEELRVTFYNEWDYVSYPMDKRTFTVKISTGSGTELLEPVTVIMDPVTLPTDLFGFKPTSQMGATVLSAGVPLGPSGVFGKSQMIQVEATATRRFYYPAVQQIVPVTLCVLMSYGAFFVKVKNWLNARLVVGGIPLLMAASYMRKNSGMAPPGTPLTMMDYWMSINAILIGLGCCHHCYCSYICERSGETAATDFDVAAAWCYPLTYGASYVWAYAVVNWRDSPLIELDGIGHSLWQITITYGAALILVLIFISIYAGMSFNKPKFMETEGDADEVAKSHYPGI